MSVVEVDGGVSLAQDSVDTKSESECNETSIEAKDKDDVGDSESSVVDNGTGNLKSEFKFKYGEAVTENGFAGKQERGDGEDAMVEELVMENHGVNFRRWK
ncbi:hypothetical protein Ancab_014247 [Ancistrocladus abbreviatus]